MIVTVVTLGLGIFTIRFWDTQVSSSSMHGQAFTCTERIMSDYSFLSGASSSLRGVSESL